MKRNLVSVRQIVGIFAIPGADKVETVQVGGWLCVAKKGEFKTGDNCLYFEIDSFVPAIPGFEFLGTPKLHQGRQGYRIRTIKLRKQISQGLAIPTSVFPSLDLSVEDLSDQLGVIKYENDITNANISSGARTKGSFPSFIPKTDQERIQNLTPYFSSRANDVFEETLKLDGSSVTMYRWDKTLSWWDKVKNFFTPIEATKFEVCSRNQRVAEGNNNFWTAAKMYNIDKELPYGYAIQGEVIAPNIQSNHEKVKSVDFYIFHVWDIKKQQYLNAAAKREFIETYFKTAKQVPIIGTIQLKDFTLESLLKRVEGQSINKGTTSEGRVYENIDNPAVSFKAISNKYLLKEK